MRVLELRSPHNLQLTDRPEQPVGPTDVAIGVEWGGICGSDTSYWTSGKSGLAVQRHPFVLGHEVSGRIVDVGSEVSGFLVGDPVAVHPARTVGELPARLHGRENLHPSLTYLGSAAKSPHTDGGFAERLVIDAVQVRHIPSGLTTRCAVLAEPLAIALHAVRRAGDLDGAAAIVSGCGPVGVLTILALRDAGVRSITAIDPSPAARQLAAKLGATTVLNVGEVIEGVHPLAFEASGSPASLGALLHGVAVGGTIVQIGNLPLEPVAAPLGLLVSRELHYVGAYRFVNEIDDALKLLARTPAAEEIISHEFPLDQATDAFTAATDRATSGKVILRITAA